MLTVLSLDHRRSTVHEREPFALTTAEQARLSRMVGRVCGGQVAFLITCNRAELITWIDRGAAPGVADGVLAIGRRLAPGLAERFLAQASRYDGEAAARHLLWVAAGLESQIEGDVQVLGQVRRAYAGAAESGSVGAELHRLFQTALRAGKRVHHETVFGKRRASLGTAAAAEVARRLGLASRRLPEMTGREVVLLGAGKAAEGAALALATLGARVVIVNRDPERAWALARVAGAGVASFDERHGAVAHADAAIVATGAAEPLLHAATLQACRAGAKHADRPLLLIDLAVPRNVEPAVGGLPGVSLVGLEDLCSEHGVDLTTRASRRAAEQIIEAELQLLRGWLQTRAFRLAGVA
jgi:glutamyl-tRNA reductase